MDTNIYLPEKEEGLFRRRMIIISGFAMAPFFFSFAGMEYFLGHADMVWVTFGGGVICLLNVAVSYYLGLNQTMLRLSLGYLFMATLYYVGSDFSSSSLLFCLALPFAASFLLGHREALIWNLMLGIGCVLLIFYAASLGISTIEAHGVDFIASYLFVFIVAIGYERARSQAQKRALDENGRLQREIESNNEIAARNDRLFADLNNALREVRELTGLIPICASCKKIRGDEDFWEHVEAYLHKRTQLTFSHSICPSCCDAAMVAIDEDVAR